MKRADEEPTPKAIEDALTQDPLHRKREIEDFLKMLIAVEPPYTFVIDAPWGSGKTFICKASCESPANGKSGSRYQPRDT